MRVWKDQYGWNVVGGNKPTKGLHGRRSLIVALWDYLLWRFE